MKNRFQYFFYVLLLSLGTPVVWGQNAVIDLTTPIASDPEVKTGTLDNGLVYYIRRNNKPENRVELRLAVNAGSILENDDQQGLAHFMEHMNFNGTKSFPKNELIDFLQKTGVKFGADINAYTSFDETVYMLQLPSDDSALVEKGYQVLEDWAHNALLDGKEIDKERGVIVAEWRMGLGAQDRMMKKFFPVIFKGSRYAERIPIGKIEIIEHFKPETLRDFYKDWYRPNLQAVMVVGDIDPDEAEARIKAHFSGLQNPAPLRERTEYDIPSNKSPLIAITTDKEATNNMVLIFFKHPATNLKTLGDFRYQLMAELFTGMLNNRLDEISQNPESPYIYAASNYGEFLARTNDAYMLTALSKENQIDKSLLALLEENERIKMYGFTATEFERQKEEILSRYDKASKESDKTESAKYTSEYLDHFLNGNAYPSTRKQLLFVKHLLPDIKLEELNTLANAWATDTNMAMVVMAPDKENVKVPTEADLLSVVNQSKNGALQPYIDKFNTSPLVTNTLTPGKTIVRKENQILGYTELQLSNGVTVIIKPTDFKNDEILVSAYSLGGNSLYADSLFMSANYASQIIRMSGAGNFDNIILEKKLKGKSLHINPYIEDVRQGIRGDAAPKDFETLLQLIYLYFDSPRKDSTAFDAFISQMSNQMKFMKGSPIMTFYDTLLKTVYPGYQRLVVFPTEARMKEIQLDEVYNIYKDRFADAGLTRFFIVGNVQVDSIAPLLEQYLGSLPSPGRNEKWNDRSPQFPDGITSLTFHKGTDPQGMVGMVFSKKFDWGTDNLLALSVLKEILSIKLTEVIREKLSGVYSPQVMMSPDHYPQSQYQMIIIFGCSPKETDKLSKTVLKEIKKIRKNGPTLSDLQKAKETLIRERETNLKKNDFWQGKLESVYYDGTDPLTIPAYQSKVDSLTVGGLQKAFESLLNPGNYVRVILKPEKK